ncbi:unnamed protein product [Prunus armeniaca]
MASSIESRGSWTTIKDLGKLRDALAKANDNVRSGENLGNKIMQAQMWFGAIGQGKKSFNNHQCWKVVKNCLRFKIIPMGPAIVLNETPLYDSTASDSPLDSSMNQDLPMQRDLRLIGRNTTKAKRESNSTNDTAKFLEQIALNCTMRIERDMKRDADEKARYETFARERDARKQDMEKKDWETMVMDTSHMSSKTKSFWKPWLSRPNPWIYETLG